MHTSINASPVGLAMLTVLFLGLGSLPYSIPFFSNNNVAAVGAAGAWRPTCTLVSSTQYAKYGDEVTLNWNSTNATGGGFSHGSGADGVQGSKKVVAHVPETFYYTAYGASGQTSCSVTVLPLEAKQPEYQRAIRIGQARVAPIAQTRLGEEIAFTVTPQPNNMQVVTAYDGVGAVRWENTYPAGQVSGGLDLDRDHIADWFIYRKESLGTRCHESDMYITWKVFYAGADGAQLYETEHVEDVCGPHDDSYAVSQWGVGGVVFSDDSAWAAVSRYYETEGKYLSGGQTTPMRVEHYIYPSVATFDTYYVNDTSLNEIRPGTNHSHVIGSHVPTGLMINHNGLLRHVFFTSMRVAQYLVEALSPTQLFADRPFIGTNDSRSGGRNYGTVGVDPQDSGHVVLISAGAGIGMYNDLFSKRVINDANAGGERHVTQYDLDTNQVDEAFWSSTIIPQNGKDTHYHNRLIYPAHFFLSSTENRSRIAYNRFADERWHFEITEPGSVFPALAVDDLFVWDIIDVDGDGKEEVFASPTGSIETANIGWYLPDWETNIYTWDKADNSLRLVQHVPDSIPHILSAFPRENITTVAGYYYPVLVGNESGERGFYAIDSTAPTLMTHIYLRAFNFATTSANILHTTDARPPADTIVLKDPPTCTLTASPTRARPGEEVTFVWGSTNANQGGFSRGTGADGTSGSKTVVVYPPETVYYTAYGDAGQAACQTTITLISPAPTCTLSASVSEAAPGETVTFTWSSTDATQGGFSRGTGTDGTSGSKSVVVYPPETVYYTAYGVGGQASCEKTITLATEKSSKTPTCTLTASTETALRGESVTFTWDSTNATQGGFSRGTGTDGASGSKTVTVYPPETVYYTAYGASGQASCQKTIELP